jgi:hypothetical protein
VGINNQGVITIKGNTITPITQHQDISGKLDASAVSITNGVISIKGTTITPLTQHQDISGKLDASAVSITNGVISIRGTSITPYVRPASGIPTTDIAADLNQMVSNMTTMVASATASAAAAAASASAAGSSATSAAALPNSNALQDIADIKAEVGNVGVYESITKDLDLTRKYINGIVDLAITYQSQDPHVFVEKLAELSKMIVKP